MAEPALPPPPAEERYALYYPYIHLRNENWLKQTLLAFQQVRRIVPTAFTLRDSHISAPYAALEGPAGPLLLPATLDAARVKHAQGRLEKKLAEHVDVIRTRYAKKEVPAAFQSGPEAFQLHRGILLGDAFAEWLVKAGLAWNSRDLDEKDAFDWLTMHPTLGAAIMSITAMSVARSEGLQIVTPSHRAHTAVLASQESEIVERLLGIEPINDESDDGGAVSAEALMQLVVTTTFDLTPLEPTDIRDLLVNGEKDLREFHDAVAGFAKRIPPGLGEAARTERMKKEAAVIFESWHEARNRLPQLKELATDTTIEKAPDKIVEAALEGAKAAAGTAVLATVLGSIPGLILSVAATVGAKMFRKKDTPLRFLSRVETVVDRRIGSLYLPQWSKMAE